MAFERLDMALEIFSMRRIRLTGMADVFVESLGSGCRWIAGITTLESASTGSADPVTLEGFAKTVDGWDRVAGRRWRVYKVGILFGEHGRIGVIDVAGKFDALVIGDKMRTNFMVVNCAAAFNADESVVDGVDDESVFVE
jgi:hypothetical protein